MISFQVLYDFCDCIYVFVYVGKYFIRSYIFYRSVRKMEKIQSNTSKCKQIQADLSKYKQIQANTSQYKQMQANASKYKQIQANAST